MQKLKNVSIQELKKDLERSRAQQRAKMRDGGAGGVAGAPSTEQLLTTVETKGGGGVGVAIGNNVHATAAPTTAVSSSSSSTLPPKPVTMSTLPVEQLDISAPLDVSSVGSSAPTPTPDKVVSFEEPGGDNKLQPSAATTSDPDAKQLKPAAGPGKGRGSKPKKSVATVKLTELEMAKLGRLGIAGGAAGGPGGGKGRGGGRSGSVSTQQGAGGAGGGKLSPRPGAGPSPRPSPRASPRPTPPGSPTAGGGRRAGSRAGGAASDQGTDGEGDAGGAAGGKKNVVRVPRKDMPTRREQFQEKQRAAKAAGKAAAGAAAGKAGAPAGEKAGEAGTAEAGATAEAAAAGAGEKRGSSSERSGSRERAAGAESKGSLTREVSKEKGAKSGSRKASLMDGTSPASRATKNINDYGYKLVALCRKGDWVGVDTVIKFIYKSNVEYDKDAASETTGWTPLMFAVRENRIQIVEQLIDLQFNVNARAKVGADCCHKKIGLLSAPV